MYSPKIEESQVRRLYQLKLAKLAEGERRITMTALVRTAVERFLKAEEEKLKVRTFSRPTVDTRA